MERARLFFLILVWGAGLSSVAYAIKSPIYVVDDSACMRTLERAAGGSAALPRLAQRDAEIVSVNNGELILLDVGTYGVYEPKTRQSGVVLRDSENLIQSSVKKSSAGHVVGVVRVDDTQTGEMRYRWQSWDLSTGNVNSKRDLPKATALFSVSEQGDRIALLLKEIGPEEDFVTAYREGRSVVEIQEPETGRVIDSKETVGIPNIFYLRNGTLFVRNSKESATLIGQEPGAAVGFTIDQASRLAVAAPRGNRLLVIGEESADFYASHSGKPLPSLPGLGGLRRIELSYGEDPKLALASDHEIAILDSEFKTVLARIRGHGFQFENLTWSADGEQLYIAFGRRLFAFDGNTGMPLYDFKGATKAEFKNLLAARDGSVLAMGNLEPRIFTGQKQSVPLGILEHRFETMLSHSGDRWWFRTEKPTTGGAPYVTEVTEVKFNPKEGDN